MATQQNPLNSLRNLINPADDVDFELNLNRHPKNHKNKSLVDALNVKISDDGTVLENDNSILINHVIYDKLNAKYGISNYEIIHVIPTNTELVLFVKYKNVNTFDIWRYREKTDTYNEEFALFYDKGIPYHKGKFSSTFTYNSFDCLIIAYCEYDGTEDCPLSTINLGNFTEGDLNGFIWKSDAEGFDDRDLDTYKLPMCPEVSLPTLADAYKVKGRSYIGNYYFYIRYKINQYDYTQWFSFGYPINNEHKNRTILHKKCCTNANFKDPCNNETLANAYETIRTNELNCFVNNNIDVINSCIRISIRHDYQLYDICQIGVVCESKTYSKHFVSSDLKLVNGADLELDISLNNLIEEELNLFKYHNFYNVKNIINKKNKIYIANYIEQSNKELNVNDINVELYKTGEIINQTNNTVKYCKFNGHEFLISDVTYKSNGGYYSSYFKSETDSKGVYAYMEYISFLYFLDKIGKSDLVTGNNIKIKYDYAYCEDRGGIGTTETIFDLSELVIAFQYIGDNPDYILQNGGDASILVPDPFNQYVFSLCKRSELGKDEDGYATSWINLFHNQGRLNVFCNRIEDKNTGKSVLAATVPNLRIIIDGSEINIGNELTSFIQTYDCSTNIDTEDFREKYQIKFNSIDNELNQQVITGLVPGEIYDFYINFIDKYGEVTPGYRLENKAIRRYCTLFNPNNNQWEEHPMSGFRFIAGEYDSKDQSGHTDNYLIPSDIKFIWKDADDKLYINLAQWCVRKYINIDGDDGYEVNINITAEEVGRIQQLFQKLLELPYDILKDLTWGDILDDEFYVDRFLPYKNINNHTLFQVPNYINTAITTHNIIKTEYKYGLRISNLPADLYGYESYFISYKKLEKRYLLDGFGTIGQMSNILLNYKNNNIGNFIKTHRLQHDSWDTYRECSIQREDNLIGSTQYTANLYNAISFAEDGQQNRTGRHTCVDFTLDRENIDPASNYDGNYFDISYIKTFTINKNIYINENAPIYRLGNIFRSHTSIIAHGLNGIFKYHAAFWFGDKLHPCATALTASGNTLFGNVFLFHFYDFYDDDENGIYLDKSASQCQLFHITDDKKPGDLIGTDTYYNVIDTLNMFGYKLKNLMCDGPENYKPISKVNYLNHFNRTVYRSNVISDESKQNKWRFFEPDAYKNIEENKGNITNLLSIGTFLYVHTEHSLFAFSDDNSLEMNNQQLQVASPDIFDTEYKEQFNTILGYGGLQQLDNWIAGSFGYIYYNKDDKQIININNKSIGLLSNDTYEYIQSFDPEYILFANDVENNRIILKLYNKQDNKTEYLSYNYKHKKFVSFHSMGFDKAYNTKDRLYLLDNNAIKSFDNTNIYGYNEATHSRGITTITKDSDISFIINRQYYEIKYLENITYKLRQRTDKDYNHKHYPVEMNLIPYSGHNLEVFNDMINTGYLNILVNDSTKNQIKDFDKPYYELGNWHLNYLRDVYNEGNQPNSDTMSRLYGNYFIIHFNFQVNKHIEFENLDVQLTQDNNR